jgi:predicted transposase/invertase (TIGR01784 family)
MVIANPLYDTAFKGLIKDLDVAKALIGTLLDTEVLEVQPFVTEYVMPMEENDERPRCVRLDYTAIIKDKNGKTQNVLVEVQKASGADLVSRFRQYLAVAGYMRKPEVNLETNEKNHLPIITIYFLGFKLDNIPTPCLKVSRQYVDMLQNKVLQTKEKFVELLTHDSIVIQTPRINTDGEPKTELEKLLSVFEQKNFLDENQSTLNYNYSFDNDFRKKMIDVLHYISSDPEERKKLDGEAYWHKIFEDTTGELLKAQEKIKMLEDKDREAQKEKSANAKEMKNDGMPIEKIAKFTGFSVQEIEEM